jgi:transposase-like protein
MQCPYCQSQSVVKNGNYSLRDGSEIQHYLCKACGKRFSDKTGTPMSGLGTPSAIVSIGLKMRGEGMGVRASSRVLDKSHSTILRWEGRMAAQASQWSPPAPENGEVTLESDELYTRVGENLPPL